ncbi:uncharacterized protein F5147DRAFT_789387 [Suillus discolor]|uniref:Uncharacterized protein n=1 Tax=Suillus discolor TaxID=1912936 RepID=A0A9P7ET16_9AGAM|nr:uncharacterized protein F5147DRAFT_789387 [Suillus discolor]KAG2088561.1 hypothetical protein F5147DRAFT_789387 [Suillus discolor]
MSDPPKMIFDFQAGASHEANSAIFSHAANILAEDREKAVEEYITQDHINPSELLQPEYMSDQMSELDTDDEDEKKERKEDIQKAANLWSGALWQDRTGVAGVLAQWQESWLVVGSLGDSRNKSRSRAVMSPAGETGTLSTPQRANASNQGGSKLESNPNSRGALVVSENISLVGVQVKEVRLWIQRDIEQAKQCKADAMLQAFLQRASCAPETKQPELLQKRLKGFLPVCNGQVEAYSLRASRQP